MRILAVSDFDLRGSGYTRIVRTLLPEVSRRGHEVTLLGLSYDGREHDMPFPVVPTDFRIGKQQIDACLQTLKPDWLVVALDMPHHADLVNAFGQRAPYVGIFPLESGPFLVPSEWADAVARMNKVFTISEFGHATLREAGITSTWLPVAVEPIFSPVYGEERLERKRKMYLDDAFVVLSVMDNQERKNLPASIQAFAKFAQQCPEANPYFILVTKRRPQELGWRIPQLLQEAGIQHRSLLHEVDLRKGGMEFVSDRELANLYGLADAYLHLTQAEGLGLPILEAMMSRVPVVVTNCTSMAYLAAEARGKLVDVEYSHIGSFMNANRYFASPESGAECLKWIYEHRGERVLEIMVDKAMAYAQSMTPERAADVFLGVLEGNEQKEAQQAEQAQPDQSAPVQGTIIQFPVRA